MCHRGKSLRLAAAAAAASTKGCHKDIPVMLKTKKTGSSCGSHVDGIDVIRPSFPLRLAPPHHTDDTSNSSCASTSTLTSSDTSVGSTTGRRQCCNNNNRKKVSFKDTVHIRHIPSLRYYTRVQLAEMYHTAMELIAIHQEFVRQLRIIQFEEDIPDGEDDDSDICSRGLEQETKEGRREKRICYEEVGNSAESSNSAQNSVTARVTDFCARKSVTSE